MRFFEGNMAKIADTGVLDGGQIGLFSPPIPNLENGIPTTDTNYEWYERDKETASDPNVEDMVDLLGYSLTDADDALLLDAAAQEQQLIEQKLVAQKNEVQIAELKSDLIEQKGEADTLKAELVTLKADLIEQKRKAETENAQLGRVAKLNEDLIKQKLEVETEKRKLVTLNTDLIEQKLEVETENAKLKEELMDPIISGNIAVDLNRKYRHLKKSDNSMLSHLNKIWSYNHRGMKSTPEFLQEVRSMLKLEAKRLRDDYENRDQEKRNDMSELRVMINDLSSIMVYHQVGLESNPESQSVMAGILKTESTRLQMEEEAKNREDEDDENTKEKSDMTELRNAAAQVKLQKRNRNNLHTHLQGRRPGGP